VASRAGVGKTAIYRRWSGKVELVAAALAEMRPVPVPEDTGSLLGDFVAYRDRQVARVTGTLMPRVVARLLGEASGNPELHEILRSEIVDRFRSALGEMLRRGIARGELREDLDVELATDVVHGTIVYRILMAQGDVAKAAEAMPGLIGLLAAPPVHSTGGRGMTTMEPAELIDARIEELGDWRGETLARVRALVKEADPEVVEEWKWRGVPVWSHAGIVCTGETYKSVVKLTFAKGASLEDPSGLFNSSLEGNTRRAIDIREGEQIDEGALKALVRAAVELNTS
jgi:AcrR family transcriptional regulator